MTHAEICPLCHGSGRLHKDFPNWITYGSDEKICHGCDGKGWVVVSDPMPVFDESYSTSNPSMV